MSEYEHLVDQLLKLNTRYLKINTWLTSFDKLKGEWASALADINKESTRDGEIKFLELDSRFAVDKIVKDEMVLVKEGVTRETEMISKELFSMLSQIKSSPVDFPPYLKACREVIESGCRQACYHSVEFRELRGMIRDALIIKK